MHYERQTEVDAHRRRRHIELYRRELRSSGTAAKRAEVTERYNLVFAGGTPSAERAQGGARAAEHRHRRSFRTSVRRPYTAVTLAS